MEIIIALVLFVGMFASWIVLPGKQATEATRREADGLLTPVVSPSKEPVSTRQFAYKEREQALSPGSRSL